MTSEPTETFPINLIQNSVKMTYERPKGLKNGLLNSYRTGLLNTAFYDSCPKQDKLFKRMLYSLTFFDVIVCERKRYGSIGWNVDYEFNLSDFTQSIRQLQMFLCDGKPTPFKTLHYIIAECFYGGRIIDAYDKRLLSTILKEMFNEKSLNGPPYRFTSNDTFTFPLRFEHRLVLKFIEELPEDVTCDVYGLHENSDFKLKLKNSNDLLISMEIVKNVKVAQKFDEADFLEKINDIIEQLPQAIDANGINCYEFSYKNSTKIVLASEIKLFNQLLNTIRESCFELQQSLQGTITFSSHIPLLTIADH